MLINSDSAQIVLHQALPSLMLDSRRDKIVAANPAMLALLGCDCVERPFSDFLDSEIATTVVFLDAVEHFGSHVDRSLVLRGAKDTCPKVQTYGVQQEPGLVLISFLDLQDLEARNRHAEMEAHQRAGLWQWQNIYGFFREVEAQNHLILEAAGEGIYGINGKGQATFVNRAAQEMLGWSADDLIGRELHSIIHHKHLNGDHFPALQCPIYASFRKDETMRVDDDVFWRKDGKPIMVEYTSTPIYDHNVLAGAVVIFRDVTERRENERKLREALTEVEQLKVKLEDENDYLLTEARSARSHAGVVGVSDAIKALNAQIDLAAKNNAHVLISGPAGTGKSLTVSAIHEASGRQRRPLVNINCSETRLEILEAELFGHKRGAFPGATRDQAGKLVMANNGTLHLDEVADLPKPLQAKLFGTLQSGGFQRPGDTGKIEVALTVIATTTRDLAAEVRAGRFRQDLFFALNLFSIQCTPLSERPEDIPYLAQHCLDRTMQRLRLPQMRLSRANISALEHYNWPGNVRELENVIERAAILAQGRRLVFDFENNGPAALNDTNAILTYEELRAVERQNMERALQRTKGKVAGAQGAASILGLPPTTIYSKIRSLGIDASSMKSE